MRNSIFLKVRQRLSEPVAVAPVVLFRILLGLCFVSYAFWDFTDLTVFEYFAQPTFFFHYPLFDRLSLPVFSVQGFSALILVMGIAAYGVMAGLFFRFFAAVLAGCLLYIYLLEKTYGTDGNFLYLLLSFLLLLTPANADLSADALINKRARKQFMPYAGLFVLKTQVVLVYLYSGVSKLFHADWLSGIVMQRRFHALITEQGEFWKVFDNRAVAYLFSYGGIALDLSAGFLLWNKRTRTIGVILVVLFHAFNKWTLDLQVMPFVMLATVVLFLDPATAERIVGTLKKLIHFKSAPIAEQKPKVLPGWVVGLVVSYIAIQLLVPLRHFLYSGNVNWTHEGFRLSWHLMNNNYVSKVYVKVKIPKDSNCVNFQPINARQVWWMSAFSDMIWQYAQYLKGELQACGQQNPEVYIDSRISLNSREYAPLVDRNVNLVNAKYNWLKSTPWILPHPDKQGAGYYTPEDDRRWREENGYTVIELDQHFAVQMSTKRK